MESITTKKNAPNWRLGLSYFGYLLIGILPLNVVTNILSAYGNNTYKIIIAISYLIVLPFWMKKLVITATTLLKRKYHIENSKVLLAFTIFYFVIIWLILFRPNLQDVIRSIVAIALEAFLVGWLLWFSLKYLRD